MKMLHRFATLAAIASVAAFQSLAEVETVTSSATTFAFYGNPEKVYSLASTTELAVWPVTWRAGETVVATSMDGTATTLSGGADATSASLPSQGGVWTLVNSVEGTARVGVPWAVFDDGGTYGASATAGFVADMVQSGPDRKLMRREAPLVAYSGDDWHGDLSKASTITFTRRIPARARNRSPSMRLACGRSRSRSPTIPRARRTSTFRLRVSCSSSSSPRTTTRSTCSTWTINPASHKQPKNQTQKETANVREKPDTRMERQRRRSRRWCLTTGMSPRRAENVTKSRNRSRFRRITAKTA